MPMALSCFAGLVDDLRSVFLTFKRCDAAAGTFTECERS